jgi:cytochrome o ubiquinol oxidase subunit IV
VKNRDKLNLPEKNHLKDSSIPLWSGFLLTLSFTFLSYFLATDFSFSTIQAHLLFLGIASLQAALQLLFFFHLKQEHKPHWYRMSFFFMLLILMIIVAGSLWIIYYLNYNLGM